MKVFKSISEVENIGDTVIALGNFDGLHKGHQELINRTVKSAKIANLKSAVFTFSNHPKNVMAGRPIIKNILSWNDKVSIIRSYGVDYLISVPFDYEMQNMDPHDFIMNVLVDKLKMKEAYCGFNFKFGHFAKGNAELLMKVGLEKDFGIHILEPIRIDNIVVSSSYIRELISEGRIDECEKYLGRYYSIGGTVVTGNKIGRTIGFPTSNIIIDEGMVTPANGVYVTYCTFNGVRFKSITNVGIKPTIGDNKYTIETHIFNFDYNIYGKEIKVEFLKKLRDELKFSSLDELRDQISKDKEMAMEYHV
ncbi:MAG: bifunctional riboflavin kinase/FAD synthetase [Eubacteriales bacterium]